MNIRIWRPFIHAVWILKSGHTEYPLDLALGARGEAIGTVPDSFEFLGGYRTAPF